MTNQAEDINGKADESMKKAGYTGQKPPEKPQDDTRHRAYMNDQGIVIGGFDISEKPQAPAGCEVCLKRIEVLEKKYGTLAERIEGDEAENKKVFDRLEIDIACLGRKVNP